MSNEQQTNPAGSALLEDATYSARGPDTRSWRSLDGAVSAIARLLLAKMLASVGNPAVQFELWNGQVIPRDGHARGFRILIRDFGALLNLVANPEVQFGEMYAARRIDVKGDLAEFLELVYRALPRVDSGEGIRPAIESGLMAAVTALEAGPDYQRQRLAGYRDRLLARYGPATAKTGSAGTQALRTFAARRLLRSRWFTRHVLLDRWFLQTHQAVFQVT